MKETAAWARKTAAERNMSLSRLNSEMLRLSMRQAREYERAMRRFFEGEPVELKQRGERYPVREDLHDRGSLR